MKTFWRRTLKVIGLMGLSALLWFGSFLSISRRGEPIPGLKLGPRTTIVTEPLNTTLYPDFCRALNASLSEGITPEKNFWTLFDETMDLSRPADYRAALIKVPGFEHAGTTTLTPLNSKPIRGPSDLGTSWESTYDHTWEGPWNAEEHPDFATWLNENEPVLSKVIEASKRPESYAPAVELEQDQMLMRVMLPYIDHCRLITRMLCARAMLAAWEHRFDDAWRDVAACQRMSGHFSRCASFLEQLLAGATVATSGKLIPQLLSLEASDEELLTRRWRDFANSMSWDPLAPNLPLLDQLMVIQLHLIFRSGREEEVHGSEDKATRSYWESFTTTLNDSFYQTALNKWDINASLEYANDRFDEAEDVLTLTTYRERIHAEQWLDEQLPGPVSDEERRAAMSSFVKGNSGPLLEVWRTFATRQFFPAYGPVNRQRTRNAQRKILYHALFVSELHRRKTGGPPKDGLELQQLARTYAAAAGIDCPDLIDLYLEQPLRLKLDGPRLVIYACGENFVDDDGADTGNLTSGDVPVVIELR